MGRASVAQRYKKIINGGALSAGPPPFHKTRHRTQKTMPVVAKINVAKRDSEPGIKAQSAAAPAATHKPGKSATASTLIQRAPIDRRRYIPSKNDKNSHFATWNVKITPHKRTNNATGRAAYRCNPSHNAVWCQKSYAGKPRIHKPDNKNVAIAAKSHERSAGKT